MGFTTLSCAETHFTLARATTDDVVTDMLMALFVLNQTPEVQTHSNAIINNKININKVRKDYNLTNNIANNNLKTPTQRTEVNNEKM